MNALLRQYVLEYLAYVDASHLVSDNNVKDVIKSLRSRVTTQFYNDYNEASDDDYSFYFENISDGVFIKVYLEEDLVVCYLADDCLVIKTTEKFVITRVHHSPFETLSSVLMELSLTGKNLPND